MAQLDPAKLEWIDSLDPALREVARGYLRNLLKPLPPKGRLADSEHDLRDDLSEPIKHLSPADAPIPVPIIVMVTFFAAVVGSGMGDGKSVPQPNLPLVIGIILAGVILVIWSKTIQRVRRRSVDKATKIIIEAALPEALFRLPLTRTEQAYRDVALELLPDNVGSGTYLSAELRKTQMRQLNALLDSGRRLDGVRDEIASTLKAASPQSLRSEADALRQRIERAADPGTRSALAQSLTLCEERLRRAEALSGMTERIEAEQELVYQAFRAAQSSIASLRVSPAVAGLDGATGTATVAEVAETIGRQTRAVEAAVQELGIRR